MSAPEARNILRIPGRLVKDPTNLSAAYPHGGTELGIVRSIIFKPGLAIERLVAEEFKTTVNAIVTGYEAVLGCVLRSWDNDMLAAVFPNIQTDGFGEVGVLGRVNAARRAGFDMAELAFKLLFVPIAADQHRWLLLHNAIPLVDETQELRMALSEEYGLSIMFHAAPDSQGRTHTWDLKENISL